MEERKEVNRDWGSSPEDLVARREAYISEAQQLCIPLHVQAEQMHRYASKKQWPEAVQKWAEENRVPRLVVDQIGPFVATMTGKEYMERLQPLVIAQGDEVNLETAEAFSTFVLKVREQNHLDDLEADLFRDLWIAGYAWMHVPVTYLGGSMPRLDPEVVPAWEMLWDPKARQQNYTDRMWHLRGRWADAAEFRRLYPSAQLSFEKAEDGGGGDSPWPIDIKNCYRTSTDEVFITTIEWRDTEPMVEIELPLSMDAKVQEMAESLGLENALLQVAVNKQGLPFAPDEERALLPYQVTPEEYDAFSAAWEASREVPFPYFIEGEREVFYQAATIGDKILRPQSRLPEGFTYHCATDELHKQRNGYLPITFVAEAADKQDFANLSLSVTLEAAMKEPKNAIWRKPGAFDDAQGNLDNWGRPGADHVVSEAQGVGWDLIKGESWRTGELLRQISQELFQSETLDPYSTGSVDDLRRTASSAVSQVTSHASQKHSGRFRALRRFREDLTRYLMRVGIAYFDRRQLRRFLGEADAAKMPVDKRIWIEALNYSVTVEETPYTSAERDAFFHKMWVDQGGLMRVFLGTPYAPSPRTFGESLKGVAMFYGRFRRSWQQDLEKAQQMIDQPPPPPGGEPPPEGG